MFLIIPAILINLARVDLLLSSVNPHSFNVLLTKIDAIYFTITTASAVGFGDIYPTSEAARGWIIIQIATGFIMTAYVFVKILSTDRPEHETQVNRKLAESVVSEPAAVEGGDQ
jgi:hypothetical protein